MSGHCSECGETGGCACANSMSLGSADLDLLLEWFGATQDLNRMFLKQADYLLAGRILRHQGRRVPDSVLVGEVTP